MNRDELVEKVARAIEARVNEPGQCSYPDMARAAIRIALEEAARVAEKLGGTIKRGNIVDALYVPPRTKDAAAAIRAMIPEEKHD